MEPNELLQHVGGLKGLLIGGGAVVALYVLVKVFSGSKEAPPSALHQDRTCGVCGWSGRVPKHKPKCPKCANSLD
jgi:hypothetical protein